MITFRRRRSARHAPRAAAAGVVRAAVACATALVLVIPNALPAHAYWTSTGTGSTATTTSTLAPPVAVTVPATADTDVAVSWAVAVGAGQIAAQGYYVVRTDGVDSGPACGSSPTSLIAPAALGCTDLDVAAGTYSYRVIAVFRSWTATSAASSSVTVAGLLGAAATYSVLAVTAVVSTGSTSVSGDLGVSPATTVTGFPPGVVGGDIHAGDAAAANAQDALTAAYNDLDARVATTELAGDLNGTVLTPGVYHSTAALALTGILTIDAGGDPDAIFIIQGGAALDTAAASSVALINGAQASNVYWVVTGAVGTGASASFAGTILAQGAITLGAGTELIGRALSKDSVTLAGNAIRFTVALPPTMTIDGGLAATTKDTTPTLTGTSDAPVNSPVTVTVDGQTLITSISGTGTWDVTASALTAGTYTVVAKVRDPSGNGAGASQELTIEVNPAIVMLGTAASYSVLAGVSVVSTGNTALSGDLGVSPGVAVTGFPPGTFDGSLHAGDAAAAAARTDLDDALTDASGRTPHTEFTGDLNGRTFHIGVHHTTAAISLTGILTLDAEGDPDAVFIFQTDAALNTAAGSTVQLVNGAQTSHVFWVVAGAAGTGANSSFAGTILADGAITIGDGGDVAGQALSRDTVTLANNVLTGVVGAP